MSSYVKTQIPKELIPQILETLSTAKDSGKVRKGVNETTKSIERKTAQFVLIAEDVQPEEIVVHLPVLCEEKGVPYAYIPTKKDLGKAVGIAVGTSSVSIEDAGGAKETLQDILKKIPKEKPGDKKPAEKKKPATEKKSSGKKEKKK